jgi:hypothetical protein
MWLDTSEYNPNDICPICHEEYGTEQAIFKTPCNHIFHNNCLNSYCETYNRQIVCPICRKDIEYSCIDVSEFKDKNLGDPRNPNGEPSFDSKHVSDIYYSQPDPQNAGKKRRKSKTRSKRSNKKKKYNKRKTYRRRK